MNVTPQYINKFLHGEDVDLKISTAIRYGRLLGLKLIEVPRDESKDDTPQVNYIINMVIKENATQPLGFRYSNILPKRKLSM